MACQLLSAVERHERLSPSYVRPEQHRPRLGDVVGDVHIPATRLGRQGKSRQIIKQIADACGSYGIFQFFRLPVEEKMRLYSDDPSKKFRLSTSFNVRKETFRNWRDYLRLHCYPPEEYAHEWPSNPPLFKSVVSSYSREVRMLGLWLLGAISEGLGLEEGTHGHKSLPALSGTGAHLRPAGPSRPQGAYHPPARTRVGGLQILKDGRWFGVDSIPNALVVSVGDQLEALSNDRYKSVWHRVLLCPFPEAMVSPAKKLTANGSPPLYRSYTYGEYYKTFWTRNLDQEHCLELFKC
ncbi:unnamed protein product [Spirodela intermedia]|uniref:Uncharacterized protein n=1 Tax=Spirodela intermedia TaxID=51605 RepID=A0A7I8IFC9_SPIIN|nr:unnamed protein product [Spirodela intermedia]CAA6656095.1 unnamed protein product [Spirodela intermedia]